MHVTILGRRWRLEFVTKFTDRHQYGECDHPEKLNKAIRIKDGMNEFDTLDSIIHEATHAAGWHVDEEFVSRFATDVARILIRLGYRRA